MCEFANGSRVRLLLHVAYFIGVKGELSWIVAVIKVGFPGNVLYRH